MKRRTLLPEADAGAGPQLPITPMLDMAFQILAFFIFTYHPSGLEGQMELNLPATGEAKAQDPSQVDVHAQSDLELKLPSEVTVIVKTSLSGQNVGLMSEIQVQQREGTTTISDLEALAKHLKKIRDTLDNKDDIQIQADSKLKWFQVVEVMDVCRNTGFRGIGFKPPPDAGGTP